MKKLIIGLAILATLGGSLYWLNAYDISSGQVVEVWATIQNKNEPGKVLVRLNQSGERRIFEVSDIFHEHTVSGNIYKVTYVIGGLSKKRRQYRLIKGE